MIINQIKTFLFITIISLMLIGILYFIFISLNPVAAQMALFYSIISVLIYNLIAFLFYKPIILKSEGAIPLDEAEIPNKKLLKETVEILARKAGIEMPEIYVIPREDINAFALHLFGRPVIAITYGALKLDEDEIEAIIGHEIGHIKNRDSLYMTVVSILSGLIVYLIEFARFAFFVENDRENFVISLILSILIPIVLFLIQLAISRNREFLADIEGAKLTSPYAMIKVLMRLKNSIPYVSINEALYFNGLLSTHPPIEERIKNIMREFNISDFVFF